MRLWKGCSRQGDFGKALRAPSSTKGGCDDQFAHGSCYRPTRGTTNKHWRILVAVLLALGLLGHLLAARAIGGSRQAYSHHVFGFFLILLVTGAVIAALGRWLWRDRPHLTWIVVGAVQALFGLIIYLDRFRIA